VKINSRVASSARYGHEEIATNHEFLIEAVKKNKTGDNGKKNAKRQTHEDMHTEKNSS